MRMIVPPVAHRREIDRNLAEFFRSHRTAHFNRAISSMCRYFNVRRPRIEWFEYIDWGKTAGRTYEDGRIHLVHPENWKRGRIYFSERKWIQMLYHEMGHFILWSDPERKADLFSRRMINGLEYPAAAAARARAPALESQARAAPQIASASAVRVSRSRANRDGHRIASRRVTARKSRRVA